MFGKVRTCVLNMPMNEGQGDPHDSSGYGNNGTNHGADWVSGDYGWAMEFNGSGDYVDCGNDASLDITDAITISAWIKPLSPSDTGTYVSKRSGDPTNYFCRVNTNKTISFYWQNGGWQGFPTGGSGAEITGWNEWNHVVVTYDNPETNIYINGVLEDSVNEATGMLADTAAVRIGSGVGVQFYKGVISDVYIYNRPLSTTEILAYFNGKKARYGL